MRENYCIVLDDDRDEVGYTELRWQSDTVTDGDILKQTLIDILNEWFKTAEGWKAFERSCDRFNVGDLGAWLPELRQLLSENGITDLTISGDSSPRARWSFSDELFDEDQETFYEAQEDRESRAGSAPAPASQ